jgi:hypothetical protein
MPHVYMMLSTSRTCSLCRVRSPVIGLTQALASVAAMTARSPAGDRDRALAQVQLEGGLDVAVEHPLAAHEVGGGPVAVGRLQLRLVGLLVDRKVVVAGVAALSVHHPLDALGDVRALDQVGRGERPGVDHRVVRPVVARIELERVERVATRLDPDAL